MQSSERSERENFLRKCEEDYNANMCLSNLISPPPIFPFPTFVKICMVFVSPRFFRGRRLRSCFYGVDAPAHCITVWLLSATLSVTLNQGDFIFYCTRVFCMFIKRNVKSSRLGFLLHSRGIAISARATANNVDMVLYSSQRLLAVCLSATEHHVALVCCCTHSSGTARRSNRKPLK